jgi:hypothetical protein
VGGLQMLLVESFVFAAGTGVGTWIGRGHGRTAGFRAGAEAERQAQRDFVAGVKADARRRIDLPHGSPEHSCTDKCIPRLPGGYWPQG